MHTYYGLSIINNVRYIKKMKKAVLVSFNHSGIKSVKGLTQSKILKVDKDSHEQNFKKE